MEKKAMEELRKILPKAYCDMVEKSLSESLWKAEKIAHGCISEIFGKEVDENKLH